MDQTLDEYLKTHKCQGFKPVPHYFAGGDYVTYYFRDERCYEQRVDDLLTVYLSMATDTLVGCKIRGVKHILRTAGDFGVMIDGDGLKLGFFFFVGASMTRGEDGKKLYEELRQIAKDVKVNHDELLAAGIDPSSPHHATSA
jgi:hypothetical protein